jgi:hypothetical protein
MHKKGYEWIKLISAEIAGGKKRKPPTTKRNNSSSSEESEEKEEPSPKTRKQRRWSPGVVPKPPEEHHRSSPIAAQLSLLALFAERPNFSANMHEQKHMKDHFSNRHLI